MQIKFLIGYPVKTIATEWQVISKLQASDFAPDKVTFNLFKSLLLNPVIDVELKKARKRLQLPEDGLTFEQYKRRKDLKADHSKEELESKRSPLFDYKSSGPNSLLADLVINNPNLGVRKTIQLFGLKQSFDCNTPRELRNMFGKYGQRSWYRLVAEAKTIKLPATQSPLDVIREDLSRFEPLKLVAFEELMLNNDKHN